MNTIRLDLDPEVRDGRLHPIVSPYADRYWTPTVGPGGMAILRWTHWHGMAGSFEVATTDQQIGQAVGLPNPSKVNSTLARLVRFGLVYQGDAHQYRVPLMLPDLPPPLARKLPGWITEGVAA